MSKPNDPIVLAFSGGLDTSYCVPWLAETYGRPVVTVTVDTGGLDERAADELAARARALGAVEHRRVDARHAYFDRVLRFLIAGNVRRGGVYPLCVGAERALQAQEVAKAAAQLGSRTVAHGCTGAGNDQVRFEVALRALAPGLEVLAPIRDQPQSRAEEAAYLAARGLPVPASGAAYSTNRGLWGVTIGGRETLTSSEPLPEAAWVLSAGAFDSPLPPARHVLAFEAPAAEVILTAHRELEKLVSTGRQLRLKEAVASSYGDWVHEGHHLDPACRDAEALLASSQERVSGEARLLFRAGACVVEGVTSAFSLMTASRGVYGEAAGEWTGADAAGFSRLLAIPGALHARAGRLGAAPPAEEKPVDEKPADEKPVEAQGAGRGRPLPLEGQGDGGIGVEKDPGEGVGRGEASARSARAAGE